MAIPAAALRRVVAAHAEGGSASVSAEDARRIVEIACLSVASDGKLAREELAALRAVSAELRAVSATELDDLVDGALSLKTRDERTERLRALGEALTTEQARHCAYKVALLTALADLASADEEFEFEIDAQDALHLTPGAAAVLTAEVHEALMET